MNIATIALVASGSTLAFAQSQDPLAPRPNGMSPATPATHLIVNATVHTSPGNVLEDTDILIVDGKVAAVGTDLAPGNAQVWDIDGAHVYAGFIDPYIEVDTPDLPSDESGTHWSNKVTPQDNALRVGLGEDAAESLRAMGFTTAMIAPDSGIFRGWTAIVSTAADFEEDSLGDPPTYLSKAGQAMGFDRGGWGDPGYPTSHMGVIALMRQTFADADTRYEGKHADSNILDHVYPQKTTFYYDISQELEAALADDIANEFNHPRIVIVDNGTAHRRLELFKEMGHPVVVPLRYPETPDVFSVGAMDSVDLATLQHFERAPANARWLHNAGLDVALTTSKRRSGEKFWDNLHTAIEKGLPADDALAMITTNAAKILKLDNHGTINKGNIANLVVASGDLFDPSADAKIIDTWIDGRRHHINHVEDNRFDGTWNLSLVGADFQVGMEIDGKSLTIVDSSGEGDPVRTKASKVNIDGNAINFLVDYDDDDMGAFISSATISPDGMIRGSSVAPNGMVIQWFGDLDDAPSMSDFTGTWNAILSGEHELDLKVSKDKVTIIERVEDGDDIEQDSTDMRIKDGVLTFTFEHEPFGDPGLFSIALTAPNDEGTIEGMGTLPSGKGFTLSATKPELDPDPVHMLPDMPDAPFGPFAYESAPEQGTYLLRGATVWTQSDDGILEDAWVLIKDGKISNVGDGPAPRVAQENHIDATGMHITPGLIDAHSHTGLFRFGVNESGQAVTAEVRISDSIDPAHPGYYRELAGGLTSSLLLHGSANPIGGQSKTIKLRWDSDKPSDMFFEGSKPGIKFALGENVKQSNWGDRNTTRYPQTRLGVETLMRDRFIRAKEYAQRGNKTEHGYRDIELETLAQILAGERLIHCHSYRQDEILMLCRLAEEFGFKIGTFQHGLETYKVAEVVKEHAIGASIFSDWWAYKYEVVDAIPFAGPINHEVGLLTSFNSDSDDVARRMHVEAGKALKYAKLSGIEMTEQQALDFVTMNPAKQLMIDDRVGSLEQGKDADVVVWTGHPLSSLSRPEMTFVDGRLLFSRDLDASMRARDGEERQRLIQLIIRDGKPLEDSDAHDEDGHNHAQPQLHYLASKYGSASPFDRDEEVLDHHFNTSRGECGCGSALPMFHTNY